MAAAATFGSEQLHLCFLHRRSRNPAGDLSKRLTS